MINLDQKYHKDYYKVWKPVPVSVYREMEANKCPTKKGYARNIARLAELSGKITRPDCCDRCKDTVKLERHHTDYNKPLDILWLCIKCHNQEHHPDSGGRCLA